MSPSIVRGYRPGCIGRVVELHGRYYAVHAGFGLAFETLVARELCEFCSRPDRARDGLWLAVQEERVEGSIAIDGARADTEGAHLRWFIVSDAVRGQGVGGALLEAAMAHCRDRGFDRVVLWTFEGLHAARHLYERAGFRLVHQQRGTRWGREVDEQRFEWRRPG